jgi:hypothetical protein
MRTVVAIAILLAFISHPVLAESEKIPAIELGIYHPDIPFENIKQRFYVRERERPLLSAISDADTSIALFLIDVSNAISMESIKTIRSVLPSAREQLRLPPVMTFDKSHRYVGSSLYCWKSENKDQLEFFIDWGDITNARYTDSYIFVRQGTSWYFKNHGSIAPRHWRQTERYFQLTCSPEIDK